MFLIHGYNNEPREVARAYQVIEEKTASHLGHYDIVVGYTWPGGDDGTDYFAAKSRAGAVSRRARPMVEFLMNNAAELGIMCHSMGARISLLFLNDMRNQGVHKTIDMRLYVMAAAVDNEALERGERYHSGSQFCDNTYVFHSRKDPVLRRIYRLAEWDRALGHSGPESPADTEIQVKVINCKKKICKHGAYKRTDDIYHYIQSEMTGPPSPRFVTL